MVTIEALNSSRVCPGSVSELRRIPDVAESPAGLPWVPLFF